MANKLPLERILHNQGFGTRKLCRMMIWNNEVTVNGLTCDDPNAEFSLDNLQYTVKGSAWDYREKSYLMLNKPSHYECSHKTLYHPSIYSLLPQPLIMRNVQCIGRLDEDTTGLILISDDGQFIHRMSSPKYKVPKIYAVRCKHPVSKEQVKRLTEGVQLVDETSPIAALACIKIDTHCLHLTLAEGKYHQVKRMIAAIGNRVEELHRIQIGDVKLPDDLSLGTWRWLSEAELASLNLAQKL